MFRHTHLIIVCGAAACTIATSVAGQETRDSAGVRIVRFDQRQPAARIVVAKLPSIEIGGGTDERATLHQVGDIRILSDGALIIANRGTGELKFFKSDGRFIRNAGRKGRGPGEFQSLERFWVTSADSILAADGRRLVVFDREGRHARTVMLETPPGRRTPRLLDLLAPNLLLGGSSDVTALPARAQPYYFTQVLYTLDHSGRVRANLGSFGDGEHFVQVMDPSHPEHGNSYWNRAFGRQTTIRAVAGRVAVGDGREAEVRVYTPAGQLVRILRGRQQPLDVTSSDIAAYKKRTLAGNDRPPMKAMTERMLAEMPFPDRFPAFERFEVDPLGRLWLKRYPRPSDSTEVWEAVEVDGRYLGQVELPPRTRLRTVGTLALLCVWRDEDDVEHVRSYAFQVTPIAG